MPSNHEERGFKNLTLRLADEYHRQLIAQAARRGLTLNAHLSNIVERHLMDSGFAPDVLKSLSGRLFEIVVEPIRQTSTFDYFCSRFDVVEHHSLYEKRRAHYIFGVDSDLCGEKDPYGVVKDVGLALLNFYNRQGYELDQLAWQTTPKDPPTPSQTMKDNWRYIGPSVTNNVAVFMVALARNHWKDDRLAITGESQDIRCKLRSESDLYR